MKKKEIDWDEVDRESDAFLEKCRLLDKQISEERKKPISLEELQKMSDEVNRYCEEHGIKTVLLEDLINEREEK